MRLLLDTEAFISLSGEGQSPWSKSTRSLLEDDDVDLLLSAVSTTEIAIKVAVGKLEFCAEDIALGAKMLKVRQVNYEPRHAQRLFSMPFFEDHRDPFDRMLIATALAEDVPIVSRDRQFKRYKGVRVLN